MSQTEIIIDECKRQEESCLYTSSALFEWIKAMRFWRIVFVIAPIVLGAIASSTFLQHADGFAAFAAGCSLVAGIFPAVYKALDLDVSLASLSKSANEFKSLQDAFRQSWRMAESIEVGELTGSFDTLMQRMNLARSATDAIPERFFLKGRKKIMEGHYKFAVDAGD